MKYARRDARIYTDLEPIDRNDPESAATAIEYGLPESFSGKAKACWQYFSGAAYLFEYKGQLVMTDESLYLTEHGDGSHEAPYGAPRGTFDTWLTGHREGPSIPGTRSKPFWSRFLMNFWKTT